MTINKDEIRKLIKEPGSIYVNLNGNAGIANLLIAMLNELDDIHKQIKELENELEAKDSK